jgi:hypothetical protein
MTTQHSLTAAGLLVAAARVAAAGYPAEVYLACAQIRPSDAALLREAATETDARGSDTLQSGPMRPIFCGGVVVDALPTAGGPDSLMRSQNVGPVLDRSYLRWSDESRESSHREYLRSPECRALRAAALERDGYRAASAIPGGGLRCITGATRGPGRKIAWRTWSLLGRPRCPARSPSPLGLQLLQVRRGAFLDQCVLVVARLDDRLLQDLLMLGRNSSSSSSSASR